MISVERDEIQFAFAGFTAVLSTIHSLHLAITCRKFHLGTGSLFCTALIPLCRDEIFPYNRFSSPNRDEKVIHVTCCLHAYMLTYMLTYMFTYIMLTYILTYMLTKEYLRKCNQI